MRLAYLLGSYPQPSETFIAREIAGVRARGHQVEVFSLFRPRVGACEGVRYGWATPGERLRRKLSPDAALRTLVRRWQRELAGCDAVMAHFGSLPSTVALHAAGDRPLIISLHARDLYVEAEQLAAKVAWADAVLTCTQANVAFLQTQFPTASAKLHLIYHGLPRHWLDAPLPDRSRNAGEPLRLLASGRLVEKKGFAVLLAACARLAAQGVAFQLRVLGDGPEGRALRRQCDRLGLAAQVTFAGWRDEADVCAAYAWADLFCCPSIIARDGDRDGLPNVLVEAMCTGLPAVGSDVSALPEAIEHERTGLLVPPGDPDALAAALRRCVDDPLRPAWGQQAARLVRARFDGECWLDYLTTLLQACVERRMHGS